LESAPFPEALRLSMRWRMVPCIYWCFMDRRYNYHASVSYTSCWSSLHKLQHRKRGLGDSQMRIRILYEAATGLAYLHSKEGGLQPVLHLDVKR